MNKLELVAAVAEKTNVTKVEAEKVIDATIAAITDGLKKDGKVALMGFGNFEKKVRAERTGKHPQTGATITIPASTTVAFKAGKALKDTL